MRRALAPQEPTVPIQPPGTAKAQGATRGQTRQLLLTTPIRRMRPRRPFQSMRGRETSITRPASRSRDLWHEWATPTTPTPSARPSTMREPSGLPPYSPSSPPSNLPSPTNESGSAPSRPLNTSAPIFRSQRIVFQPMQQTFTLLHWPDPNGSWTSPLASLQEPLNSSLTTGRQPPPFSVGDMRWQRPSFDRPRTTDSMPSDDAFWPPRHTESTPSPNANNVDDSDTWPRTVTSTPVLDASTTSPVTSPTLVISQPHTPSNASSAAILDITHLTVPIHDACVIKTPSDNAPTGASLLPSPGRTTPDLTWSNGPSTPPTQ